MAAEVLDAGGAKTYAGSISGRSTELDGKLKSAIATMDQVASIWQSPKASAYRGKFDEAAAVFPKVKMFVENLSEKISISVKNFEINEQGANGGSGGSSAGTSRNMTK